MCGIRNNSGFSLMELMVVIAIIAILSTIAIPGFISWFPEYKLSNGSRDVLSIIERARMRAVRERASVGVEILGDGVGYRAWIDDGSGAGTANDATLNGTERIIANLELPSGIRCSDVKFPNSGGSQPRFRFNSQGFPLDPGNNPTDGKVEITNGIYKRFIHLSIAGNAVISKEDNP